MFGFKYLVFGCSKTCFLISIHYMFGFKSCVSPAIVKISPFQYIICLGSRKPRDKKYKLADGFQYIICLGSSFQIHILDRYNLYFNTLYVWVQVTLRRLYHAIKPNFNTLYVWVQVAVAIKTKNEN